MSEATGIPPGTVKSYISRGAAKWRERLADYRPAAQGRGLYGKICDGSSQQL
ncbi:MAG: hypothetical protein LBT74_04545 [Acidobacteriota bacterium]|nr:hypothetical protein [Acidobacteriota bacterium]